MSASLGYSSSQSSSDTYGEQTRTSTASQVTYSSVGRLTLSATCPVRVLLLSPGLLYSRFPALFSLPFIFGSHASLSVSQFAILSLSLSLSLFVSSRSLSHPPTPTPLPFLSHLYSTQPAPTVGQVHSPFCKEDVAECRESSRQQKQQYLRRRRRSPERKVDLYGRKMAGLCRLYVRSCLRCALTFL